MSRKGHTVTPLSFCAHSSVRMGQLGFFCLTFLLVLVLPHDFTIFSHLYPYILPFPALHPCYQMLWATSETSCFLFPQHGGSRYALMSCYLWHWPVTGPWHCFRHGQFDWSWKDSLAHVYTTAGFVQKDMAQLWGAHCCESTPVSTT